MRRQHTALIATAMLVLFGVAGATPGEPDRIEPRQALTLMGVTSEALVVAGLDPASVHDVAVALWSMQSEVRLISEAQRALSVVRTTEPPDSEAEAAACKALEEATVHALTMLADASAQIDATLLIRARRNLQFGLGGALLASDLSSDDAKSLALQAQASLQRIPEFISAPPIDLRLLEDARATQDVQLAQARLSSHLDIVSQRFSTEIEALAGSD